MTRTTPIALFAVYWARITNTWQAAVDFVAPMGYEDEAGFHYGPQPVRCEARY